MTVGFRRVRAPTVIRGFIGGGFSQSQGAHRHSFLRSAQGTVQFSVSGQVPASGSGRPVRGLSPSRWSAQFPVATGGLLSLGPSPKSSVSYLARYRLSFGLVGLVIIRTRSLDEKLPKPGVVTSSGMKGQLKQFGFILDDFVACVPPARVALDKKSVMKGECVIIGGVERRLGSKASPWASHCGPLTRHRTRESNWGPGYRDPQAKRRPSRSTPLPWCRPACFP